MFEFARNPYYNLVVIYIFAPYFAREVAGGGADGQAWAGLSVTLAGLVCAVTVPLIGAAADRGTSLKSALAMLLTVLGLTSLSLWFVTPGSGAAGLALGVTLSVIGYCAYTYTELLHNAMLSMTARPSALPMVSGIALGLGNSAAVLMFLIMLAFFILPVQMPGALGLGTMPAFGLDASAFEHVRVVGPAVALWLALFIAPFFLLMPDRHPVTTPWTRAFRDVLNGDGRGGGLGARLTAFRRHLASLNRDAPDAMRFLLARLAYADGMAALLALGAVYAQGFLGWGPVELVVLAITSSSCAALGAAIGGALDRWLGPRRALLFELGALLSLFAVSIGVTEDAILYGLIPAGEPLHSGALFARLPDLTYLGLILPMAMMVGAVITSSRVMLVQLAPVHRQGEFFGLFFVVGTVTVWIGPGLVSLTTALSGDQRIGMASISVLFLIGLALLTTIRKGARARARA
jgi:UMF1 family MFS transporter